MHKRPQSPTPGFAWAAIGVSIALLTANGAALAQPKAPLAPPKAAPIPAPSTPVALAAPVSPAAAATPIAALPAELPPQAGGDAPSVTEHLLVEAEARAAERARLEAEIAQKNALAAQKAALENAQKAHSEAARALARQQARAQAALVALTELQGRLAARRVQFATNARERLQLENHLYQRTSNENLTTDQAEALYAEVVNAGDPARRELRRALEALSAPSDVPEQPASLDGLGGVPAGLEDQAKALREVIGSVDALAERLAAEERRQRGTQAADLARHVVRLNRMRAGLLEQMSWRRAEALRGLTSEGLKELSREWEHLRLLTRWAPVSWLRLMRGESGLADDLRSLGELTWALLKLMALIALWLVLRNRIQALTVPARGLLTEWVRSPWLRRLGTTVLRVVAVLGKELLLVTLVIMAGDVVGGGTLAEMAVIYALVLTWAWYRLTFVALHHYLRSAVRLRAVELTAATSERILWSLQQFGRYAFAVVAARVFTDHTVGDGFLLTVVERFAWLGAIPIAVRVIQRWRPSIIATYLHNFPTGQLADRVRASSGERKGTAVALFAFGYVAVRGITLYLRDVAMRFDQTRRALAFLFRKRLERHAERLVRPPEDLDVLPPSLREAFDGGPAPVDQALADVPELEAIQALITRWRNGGPGHSVIVVGEHGIGLTTWLNLLAARQAQVDPATASEADAGVTPAAARQARAMLVRQGHFDRRRTSTADMCRLLSQVAGVESCSEPVSLIEALCSGPRRLVLLDDCERGLLRSMDGLDGWRTLCQVIVNTTPHVFWVCACTRSMWRFARAVNRDRDIFSRRVELVQWSERRIEALITTRMAQAGYTAIYDDLVIDELEGAVPEAEGLRVAQRYQRLLWGYADGNPRDACHFWLRSLVPEGEGKVRVRLFRSPNADELEQLGQLSRFVLALVVQHGDLTAEEAARALGEPVRDCRASLAFLVARGYLHSDGRLFQVDHHWHRTVLTYLRRKHLAYD